MKIPYKSFYLFIKGHFFYYFAEIILLLFLCSYLIFGHLITDQLWLKMEQQQNHLKILLESDLKPKVTKDSLTQGLFNKATQCRLIHFNKKTFMIEIASKQALLLLHHKKINYPQCAKPKKWLEQLYKTRQGQQIRKQIKGWNKYHYYTAIRDNRPYDNQASHFLFTLRGERPNQWQVYQKNKSLLMPASSLNKDLPLSYGFLGYDLMQQFNDWRVIAPPRLKKGKIQFSNIIPALSTTLLIDVIGKIEKIEINGIDKITSIPILRLCQHKRFPPKCTKHELTKANRIQFPASLKQRKIVISVQPVNHLTEALAKKLITYHYSIEKHPKGKKYTVKENNLSLRYSTKDKASFYLQWKDTKPYIKRLKTAPIDFQIVSADNMTLFKKTSQPHSVARITPKALELGLAPIVGIDRYDIQSLAGYLFQQKLTTQQNIQLSIQTDYQAIALKYLTEGINKLSYPEKYIRQRRGAVILLDGGACNSQQILNGDNCTDNKIGQILAAATIPMVKTGANIWDVKGVEKWNPALSPLSTHAWSQANVHYFPGSTFKSITALTAIQEALSGNIKIAQIIAGLSQQKLFKKLGLKSTDYSLIIKNQAGKEDFEIHNFQNEKLSKALKTPLYSGCPKARYKSTSSQLGLCESLMTSINLWFIQIALLIDQQKLLASDQISEKIGIPKDLAFQKMIHHIFPENYFNLTQPLGFKQPHYGRLNMEPIVLALDKKETGHQLNLAQNSIGQAVQVTPLHMAILYASIANGQIITPKLFPLHENSVVKPLLTGHWRKGIHIKSADGLSVKVGLANLHAGLNAVVNGRNIHRKGKKTWAGRYAGTASKAFLKNSKKIMKYVYGKTGTAATDINHHLLTLWFTGWIDPSPKLGLKRRIIFSCMMTHGRSGKDTGGKICAPIIAKILRDIVNGNSQLK